MHPKLRPDRSLTLVELEAVIAIIGVLAVLLLPPVSPHERSNRDILVDPNRSLLARYVPKAEAYKCPSDKTEMARSLGMNNRMNPNRPKRGTFPLWLGGYGTNYMIYRKTSDMGNPARLWVIKDERHDSINDAYFAVDLSNTGTFFGDGGAGPLLVDQHPGELP